MGAMETRLEMRPGDYETCNFISDTDKSTVYNPMRWDGQSNEPATDSGDKTDTKNRVTAEL